MIKVVHLTNTMSPYRIPVLNKVASHERIDLEVWYLKEQESNRKWIINKEEINYKFHCLKGISFFVQKLDMGIHINPFVFLKLLKKSPDVVFVTGYDAIAYWTAIAYAKLFKKKVSVWWGSTLNSSRIQNKMVNAVRQFYFSRADTFITYGSDATDCLIHYGVNKGKIITGYNTVDIKYFYRETRRSILKRDRNSSVLKLLFVGQLIPRKGLEETFEILKKLDTNNWELDIIGSGPEELTYKKMINDFGLQHKVNFIGYKQKEELVAFIKAADCLLFPSILEVWGLVVNEALASGKFILSSKYAGVTSDLIIHKHNGYIIDPLDKVQYTEALKWVVENKKFIREKVYSPLSVWKKMHTDTYANAVIKALES
ncbi:hypothetical protein CN383_16205 [Priestia megaterium]|uniref:glycosyltransferase n=1 Tax=Priestia megaterium TaxID=1404 RepID=UPI000BF30559|nr:glycosyltransferase [Priestia megaterium]PFA99193.1 hypothetical protein CN383_16205 [Priestia megaterium]